MKKVTDLQILVVDDDPELLSTTLDMFQLFGLRATGAENGVKAWEKLQSTPFDLVLSDIRMPQMNGLELLKKIRAELSREIVVLLTSGFHEFEISELFHLGVNGFFQKPVSSSSLREGMSRAVTPPQQRWSTAPETCQYTIKETYTNHEQMLTDKKLRWGKEGFSLELPNIPLLLGQHVEFCIDLTQEPALKQILGAGVVRWKTPAGHTGIMIDYLEDASRRTVCGWLKELTSTSTIPAN